MSRVSNKKKTKGKSKIGKIFLISLLMFSLILIAGLIGVSVAVVRSSPDITSDILNNLKQSSKIYDLNGNYIEDYSDSQVRSILSFKDIPDSMKNAFVAIEDERFWQHHGVDLKRIIGALWVDLKTRSSAQGASTITQQLVKNVFLTQEKKITRKIQEAYMSLQLERKLSKNQILEAYLNTIYLGGSSYGIEAAAMSYYGKDVKDLTISQCAYIAGLNKNPAKYYPIKFLKAKSKIIDKYDEANSELKKQYRAHTIDKQQYLSSKDDNAKKQDDEIEVLKEPLKTRRNIVLQKMRDQNYISQEQLETAKAEDVDTFDIKENSIGMKYQWFIEPAIDEVAQDFSDRYGIDKSEAKQRLRVGGYSIYLTIDPNIQSAAEDVIDDSSNYAGVRIPKSLRSYTSEKPTDNNPNPRKYDQPQAAAVIYDYTTGQMRAIVGGRGKHPRLSTNRATDVPRQPGSSIKPLAVYGPAIDSKLATAATVINDSPMSKEFVAAHNNWNPHNYETNKFSGLVTIREAIKKSINIVAIKLADMLNPDPSTGAIHNEYSTSIDYLTNKFHLSTIKTTGPNSDRSLSPLALGALTEGVYPYEMAAAYGVFGNNGVYTSPVMYTKVVDNMGNTILESTSNKSQSISPQAAYIMTDLLKGVVKAGTGTRASLGSMPAAGKTGTAADKTNLWFCGLTPYYSGAVWIGHDKPNVPINGLSSSDAAKIWGKIMKKAHEKLKVKDFIMPSGITTAQVCTKSGKAPNDLCFKSNTVITDLFIEGTEPVEICNYHNQNSGTLNPSDNGDINNPSDENNPDNNSGNDTTTIPGVDTVPPVQ